LVGEQLGRVVGVEVVDRDAEVDLAEGLLDGLAHLADDDLAEVLTALGVQLADAPDERGALLDGRRRRPPAMRLIGAADRGIEVRVADRGVLLDALSRRRVDDGVLAHAFPPWQGWTGTPVRREH